MLKILSSKAFAIIVDLDGTLLDGCHRHHYVTEDIKDFDTFRREAVNDRINKKIRTLVNFIYRFTPIKVILFTGRDTKVRYNTIKCLKRHGVLYDHLFMRRDGDNSPDSYFKSNYFLKYIQPNFTVLLAIDDRPSVVEIFKRLGVPCIKVKNPNPESYEKLARAFDNRQEVVEREKEPA